jgi:predicted RNA-binding protein with EMAP domain
VTNLLKTRPTQLMKVAMVYPEEIINILSEAQFVGEAAPADAATSPTPLTEEQKQEIRRTMGKYLEI